MTRTRRRGTTGGALKAATFGFEFESELSPCYFDYELCCVRNSLPERDLPEFKPSISSGVSHMQQVRGTYLTHETVVHATGHS